MSSNTTARVDEEERCDEQIDTWTEVTDCQSDHQILSNQLNVNQFMVILTAVELILPSVFAPAKHNRHISIFLDKHSEELALPHIFWSMHDLNIIPLKSTTLTL